MTNNQCSQRNGHHVRLRMATEVHRRIMHSVGARRPETGGILLGPANEDIVTGFYLDERGRCTAGTYSPDHETISAKILEEWRPAGLEFRGVAHSHPELAVHLSGGDLSYIRRIFACNPSMTVFLAPVVIPALFWIRPFLVRRDPFGIEEGVLELVDRESDLT